MTLESKGTLFALIDSLRHLSVLCVSAVNQDHQNFTAESQRTQRLRREELKLVKATSKNLQ
jgi:hypothetical protein